MIGGAQGVELHQLAGVVLVGMTSPVGLIGQVLEHRRAVGAGFEQVGKTAHRVAPDHFPVVHQLEKEPRR